MSMSNQKALQDGLIFLNIKVLLLLTLGQLAKEPKGCLTLGEVVHHVDNDGKYIILEPKLGSVMMNENGYQQDPDQVVSEFSETTETSDERSHSCRYFKSSQRLICNGSIDFAYLKTLQQEHINDFIIEKYETESFYKKKYWSTKDLETGEWYFKLPKIYQKLTGMIQLKDTGLQINVNMRMIPRKDLKGFIVDGEAFSNKIIKILWRVKGDLILEYIKNRTVISMDVGADAVDSDWRLQSNLTFVKRNPENEADDWKAFGIIKSDYVSENQFILYKGTIWTRMTKEECKFSGDIKLHNVNLIGAISGTVSPPHTGQISIPKSAFSNMNIKNIIFKDSNFYKDFDKNAFEGLNGVKRITFVGSKLEVLPRLDELFQSVSTLEEIIIEDCTTPSLRFGSLPTLSSVRKLSFKGSGPLNFNDISFMWLKNSSLTYLNLQHSHIKVSVKTKAILWCVNNTLKHLDISHSTLTEEKDLIPILNGLKIITLSADGLKLRKVPTNALYSVRKTLEYLSLRGNDFRKNLEKHMFDTILSFPVMLNLRELNLMECHINYLEKGAFDNLVNLKTLHLGYNNLENVQDGWIFMTPKLTYLDLTNNGLTPQNPSTSYYLGNTMNLSKFEELTTLDLSNGIFTNLNTLISSLGSNLRNLSLRDTGLEDLPENVFEKFINLEVLDLSHNRNLKIVQSLSFNALKNFKNLKILDLKHCGITGTTAFQDSDFGNESQDFLLENVEIIDLSGNSIKILDPKTFKPFPKLKFLNLSGNSINMWKMSLFLFNEYLDILFLDENKIESITEVMLRDIEKLKHVKLGHNPFTCGSYVYDIKNMATQFGSVKWVFPKNFPHVSGENDLDEQYEEKNFYFIERLFNNIMDSSDSGYMKIMDWSENNYICFSWSQDKFIPFTRVDENFEDVIDGKKDVREVAFQLLPLVACAGVVLTIIIICWKFLDVHLITRAVRNAVALSFLSKGEKEPDKYEYNVFVSYSDKDRSWVLENLLPRLESWKDVKVCLHERDFQVGLSIMENIIASIDASRNIVLVLSNSFLKSQWCQYEMHLAQHRLLEKGRDQLILILLENIPAIRRPKTLKYLMMTKTYIEWPLNPRSQKEVDIFWNRLMKSLISAC